MISMKVCNIYFSILIKQPIFFLKTMQCDQSYIMGHGLKKLVQKHVDLKKKLDYYKCKNCIMNYLVILLHMFKSFFLVYSHNKMFYKIYYNTCAFLNLYTSFFIYDQDRQGWMERFVNTLRKTRGIFLSELTQGESQTLKWSRSVLPQCVTELASKVQLVSWFIFLLNKYI